MSWSLIYARDRRGCIGKDGGLPWRLPDDFRHFKQTTMGRPIVMGRRTFEDHRTVLPGRLNIVLTRRSDYPAPEGMIVVSSLEAAAAACASEGPGERFIIGGAGLLETGFADAVCVYETIVDTEVQGGDTFVPRFDFSGWEREILAQHAVDERHAHAFEVVRWRRLGVA